jgi:hypothetical protein
VGFRLIRKGLRFFRQPDNNSPDTLRLDNNTDRLGELRSQNKYSTLQSSRNQKTKHQKTKPTMETLRGGAATKNHLAANERE